MEIDIKKNEEVVKKKPLSKVNVGSRKTSRAIVQILKDKTLKTVNGRDIKTYFKEDRFIEQILSPMKLTDVDFGFKAKIIGGGISAQSWSLRYVISKLIACESEENKKKLKLIGFLSGDSRSVERKKVGRYKARAKYPFNRR